jgi:RNA ligase (TIGR02306 family)
VSDGEAERPHPAFHKYTDVENYRNFPGLFRDGEEVVFTEKLHGKNCRVGLVRVAEESGNVSWTWMAGSHDVRRKEFATLQKKTTDPQTGEEKAVPITRRSQFWEALTEPVKSLLQDAAAGEHDAVVFGELYGSGVQDMAYGFENGRFAFRVFDIAVDGKYLDFDVKTALCSRHGVDMVPMLYRGPFSAEQVEEHSSGPTTLCAAEKAGKFKGREGIVIVPVKERAVTTEAKVFDRLILKCISFDYLERKGGTEWH